MSRSVSLQLQQKQAPSLKQMQRLMMSQHMQQALHLLQLPILELEAAVELELEQNPVLEQAIDQDSQDPEMASLEEEHLDGEEGETELEKSLSFNEKDLQILQHLDVDFRDHFNSSEPLYHIPAAEEEKRRSYQESLIQAPASLYESLMQQAQETFSSATEKAMAEELIGNFDAHGFLQTSLEEIALTNHFKVAELERVLKEIQTFEPSGVGAKDLRESLLIQLRAKQAAGTLAYTIVEKQFDNLLRNHLPMIKKALKCTEEEIKRAIEQIAKLDLNPGASLASHLVQTIRPDIVLRQDGEELIVEIEDELLPRVRFSRRYLKMLEDETLPEETKEFIRKKLVSARWLLRTVHQRNETLERMATFLAKHQREFFLHPEGKLVPLTMKTVADALEVHESTIARSVANKYIETPRGLLPLRSFFTTALPSSRGGNVSSQSVREIMLELIKREDKRHPLSDDAIASHVRNQGIQCARRTVAKYRLLLKIGNAHQRKQY